MIIRKFCAILLFIAFISFAGVAFAAPKEKKTVRVVEIQTRDEMILTGVLTLPKNANIKSKVPIVLLFHSLGSNKTVYEKIANDLKAKNIASLAIDLRGHYQSTTKLSGKRTYWQNYSNKVYQKYPNDILDIVDFVSNNYVAVDTNRIGIVGADISANAAIISTGKLKNRVKTMVLLSPTMNFKGLATGNSLMNYGNHPIMIVSCQNATSDYRNAKLLAKYAGGKVNFVTVKSGGTGDNMIKINQDLNKTIVSWFEKNL